MRMWKGFCVLIWRHLQARSYHKRMILSTCVFLANSTLVLCIVFDFETKYMQAGKKGKGGTKGAQGYSKIPADLPKDLYAKAESTGIAAYKALGCVGFARIDMLIDDKTKEVYFNEVNPMPDGLYAHNWSAAGISNVELVQKLIGYAKERHRQREALTTTFSTNYLQQF